jgi:hypothetical protein
MYDLVVRLGGRDRNGNVVNDVQDGDGDDVSGKEPVGDKDVFNRAPRDGAEEHDCVGDPHHGDQQVDGPFELGVFLALRNTERQRDCRQHNHQLPTPKRECGQPIRKQPHVAGTLNDVVRRGE